MLETVHEYAREKLQESAEARELRRRHAEYFLALAEEAEPELKGPGQYEWIERLEAEQDNMRAAFIWLLDVGDIESGLRLAGALRRFWHVRGYFEEGRGRLEQALAQDGRPSVSAKAKALEAVAGLAHDQGDIDRARAAAQEGLELCAGSDTGSGRVASFRRTLGITAEREGDYERATELHEESLALYREAGMIGTSPLPSSAWPMSWWCGKSTSGRGNSTGKPLASPGSWATLTSMLPAWPTWATSTCSMATTSRRRRSTKKRRSCTGTEGQGEVWCMLWITWPGRRSCVGTMSEPGLCMRRPSRCARSSATS